MNGFTVHLSNGLFVEFPDGADSAPAVVDWFRDARPDQVVTLNSTDGATMHVQKRHITHIAVDA